MTCTETILKVDEHKSELGAKIGFMVKFVTIEIMVDYCTSCLPEQGNENIGPL